MQTAHANRDAIVAGYEAFGRGEMDKVREAWNDDIEWVIPGRSPLAGTYRGADQIMGFFARLNELAGGTFKLDVRDVLASDEHVAVLVRAHAERAGRTLDSEGVQVWDMRGGKASRFINLDADPYGDDEFWS